MHIVKIDEIWQKCISVQVWKSIFWIEAASFIAAGTVCSLLRPDRLLRSGLTVGLPNFELEQWEKIPRIFFEH